MTTEYTEDRHLYSGLESPELRMHLVRSHYDPPEWGEKLGTPGRYDYSLLIFVDTSVAAGGLGVSGEGPGIFFYPAEKEVLGFAQQLLDEADRAG